MQVRAPRLESQGICPPHCAEDVKRVVLHAAAVALDVQRGVDEDVLASWRTLRSFIEAAETLFADLGYDEDFVRIYNATRDGPRLVEIER